MIIDIILDRQSGEKYTHETMRDIYEQAMNFYFLDLARALDFGEEKDIKKELCNYITSENYRESICEYINSKNWLI